ncbi:MAG TPA: hypothetical protein VFU14_09050 [Acidimicrobiales bacterium]|nr:hypothetical protein [Acidimicrobiales bacterium]
MKKTLIASALLAGALVGGTAVAGAADGGDAGRADHGELVRFAAAPASLEGHATMVRTGDGSTIVSLHVSGLEPGATYGAHVHNRPCSTNLGGTHYEHPGFEGGPAGYEDEIWPGPFTTNAAGVGRGRVVVPVTAGPDAVSVVVHAPGGTKIACADLTDAPVFVPDPV